MQPLTDADLERTAPIPQSEWQMLAERKDIAYARAVRTCDRIIRELDEILKGSKYDGKSRQPADTGRRA